ncbi:MAG: DUF411 domain-containing protein [Gallionella sp.]|nr:DUF411 domain-containing protein [Gallionella sp.]
MNTSKSNFTKASFRDCAMLRNLALYAVLAAASPVMAQPIGTDSGQALPVVELYKSPQCGCCKAWAEHLQKNGFTVSLHDVDDVPAARKKLGMPSRFGACHTAKVGKYLVEGHVPAADIKRLLKQHPKALGLAVPSMPPGSPGMEGERSVPYDTLLVKEDGNAKVFARH